MPKQVDEDYLKSLEDYEDIKDYIDMDALSQELDESKFPEFKPDFSCAIVVDNIPSVPPEKVAKLTGVLLKIYAQISKNIKESSIYMPMNPETNTTCGFCFVKFSNAEEAENAMKVTQGFAIDKKHSFKVSLYSDLDKYAAIPDDYKAPAPPAFNPRPDPTSWLSDPHGRDQFVTRHGRETEICWANGTGEEPTSIYGGEREKQDGKVWCESYVTWSPQGTYLATFHAQGVKLWGSSDFQAQGRFMHPKVEELSFSPNEDYLVTYRFTYHHNCNPAEAIIVWDVRTNAKLRAFELKNPLDLKFQVQATVITELRENKKVEKVIRGRVKAYDGDSSGGVFTIEEGKTIHKDVPTDKVQPIQEPNRLKWSSDGRYLARLGCDIISVYSLPTMTLLDKKSIAAKDVLDFVWSARSNLISYWSPAEGNHPALINILQLPDRKEICSRKIFDVLNGRMVWQNEGEYLCVHMTKMQGKKKSYVLMFFRVNAPGVPVEQLELAEPILNVSWEPAGDRIVIVFGEPRSPSIAFYSMSSGSVSAASTGVVAAKGTSVVGAAPGGASGGSGGGGSSGKNNAQVAAKKELTHLFTRTGVQCNDVIWSPAGSVVALAYFAPDACIFDLLDVETNNVMASRRHDRCSRLYWDPSGRYIASCTITDLRNVSAKPQFDDGFNLYTFQGTPLCQAKREKLVQFAWRPRPKDLLSPEEKRKVIKNLKKYEKMFEREDRQRKQELQAEVMAARFKQAEEFLAWRKRAAAAAMALKPRRVAIRDGYDSDDERNYKIEVTIDETVIKSTDQFIH